MHELLPVVLGVAAIVVLALPAMLIAGRARTRRHRPYGRIGAQPGRSKLPAPPGARPGTGEEVLARVRHDREETAIRLEGLQRRVAAEAERLAQITAFVAAYGDYAHRLSRQPGNGPSAPLRAGHEARGTEAGPTCERESDADLSSAGDAIAPYAPAGPVEVGAAEAPRIFDVSSGAGASSRRYGPTNGSSPHGGY